MTKAYISGPISGVANATVIFYEAEEALLKEGYEIFNPMSIVSPWEDDMLDEGASESGSLVPAVWVYFMKKGLKMLLECDCLVLLPGYEDSKGSMIEKKLAEDLYLPVYRLREIVGEAEFVRKS